MPKTLSNKQHITGTVIKSLRQKGYLSDAQGGRFSLEDSTKLDDRFNQINEKIDSIFSQQLSALEKYTKAVETLAKESAQYKGAANSAKQNNDPELAQSFQEVIDKITDMADSLSLNNTITKQLADNFSDYGRESLFLQRKLNSIFENPEKKQAPRSFEEAEQAHVNAQGKEGNAKNTKSSKARNVKLVINAQSVLLNVSKELAGAFIPKNPPKNVERKSGIDDPTKTDPASKMKSDGGAVLFGMALWQIFDKYFGDSSVIGAALHYIADGIAKLANLPKLIISKTKSAVSSVVDATATATGRGAAKAAETGAAKAAEKGAEKAAETGAAKAAEKGAEKAAEKAAVKGVEKTGLTVGERAGESLVGRAARSAGVKGAAKIGGRATNGIPFLGPIIGGVADYGVRRTLLKQNNYQSVIGAVASTIGGEIGQLAGAAGGAAIGGVTGLGVGAIPGAATGAFVGGVGGSLIGGEIADRFTGASNAEVLNERNTSGSPGANVTGSAGASDLTMQTMRHFEGFNENGRGGKPYWDVNNWRIGYGSSTYIDANGKRQSLGNDSTKVPNVKISRDQAEKDLRIRIPEYQTNGVIKYIGQEAWDRLDEPSKAALTSIAYNYGSIGKYPSLISAAKSGNKEQLAKAIEERARDNNGQNRERRMKEANLVRTGNLKPIAQATQPTSLMTQPSIDNRQISTTSQILNSAASTNTGSSSAPVIINNNNMVAPTNVVQGGGGGGGGITTTLVRNGDNSFLRNQDKHHNRFV